MAAVLEHYRTSSRVAVACEMAHPPSNLIAMTGTAQGAAQALKCLRMCLQLSNVVCRCHLTAVLALVL